MVTRVSRSRPAGSRFCVLCCVEAFDTLDVVFFFFFLIINEGLAAFKRSVLCSDLYIQLDAALSGPAFGTRDGMARRLDIHGEN